MKNTYLYFAKAAGTEALANQAENYIQMTTSTTDPVVPGTDAYANGVFKASITCSAIDGDSADMAWGTYYGDVAAGQVVTFPNEAIKSYHATNGTLTLYTVAEDATYGFTHSSTSNDNDWVLTMLKPVDPDDCKMYPASNLRGIHPTSATVTALYFDALTGDANDVDTVTLTHTSGYHKQLGQMLQNAVTRPENQGKVIVFADVFSGTYFDNNSAGINTVAFTLDT